MARGGHWDLSVAPAPALTDLTPSLPVRCPYTPFAEPHPPPSLCPPLARQHHRVPSPSLFPPVLLSSSPSAWISPCAPPPSCLYVLFSALLPCPALSTALSPCSPRPSFLTLPPPLAGQQTPRWLTPSLSLGPSSHPRPGGPRQCGRGGWEGQPGPGACLTCGLTRLQVTTAAATALMGWSPSAP